MSTRELVGPPRFSGTWCLQRVGLRFAVNRDALSLLASVALPAILHLRTLAPTVYNLDSAEFATAGATLGIPHPPGYPLYVLLAKVFSFVPLGDLAYRINLMSVFFAAVALVFVHLTVRRLTHSNLAALGATWILGLSFPFWSDAVVAEVYTLDAALLAAMLFFLVRWDEGRRPADLLLAFAVLGLSLANRTTSLLYLPAIALFIAPALLREPRLALAAFATLPGISLYLLLPLRAISGVAYRWGTTFSPDLTPIPIDLTDPSTLWWYVSAQIFRPLTQVYTWPERFDEAATFAFDFWSAFLGGVLLVLVGAFYLFPTRRRLLLLLAMIALPQAAFFINYAVIDKETMFLPVYVIAAVIAGCGIAAALTALSAASLRPARLAFAGSIAVLVLALVAVNFPLVDVSHDYRARDRAEQFFAAAEPDAIAIGWWTDLAPLEYLQVIEGRRADVRLVYTWAYQPGELRALASRSLESGLPVYVLHEEAWAEAAFEADSEGYWYRLKSAEQAERLLLDGTE
jgi:hypothetical protein